MTPDRKLTIPSKELYNDFDPYSFALIRAGLSRVRADEVRVVSNFHDGFLHRQEIEQIRQHRLKLPWPPNREETIKLISTIKRTHLCNSFDGESIFLNHLVYDPDPELMSLTTIPAIVSVFNTHNRQVSDEDNKLFLGITAMSADILTLAHVRYLWEIKQRTNFLMIGLDRDATLSARKGVERPVYPFSFRAASLLSIRDPAGDQIVDMVFPVYEDPNSDFGRSSNLWYSLTPGTPDRRAKMDYSCVRIFHTIGRTEEVEDRLQHDKDVYDFEHNVPGSVGIPVYCPDVSSSALIARFSIRRNEAMFRDWPDDGTEKRWVHL